MNQYIEKEIVCKYLWNRRNKEEKTTKPYIYCLLKLVHSENEKKNTKKNKPSHRIPVLSSVSVESFAFYYG